jgi:hypothetical protein
MVLTVFGTTFRKDADYEREAELSRQMAKAASRQPGFISYKAYTASDGDVIGIIRFEPDVEAERVGGRTPTFVKGAPLLGREQGDGPAQLPGLDVRRQ